MSQIKELKENDLNNANFITVLQTIYPDAKTKYYDLLVRLIKNQVNQDSSLPKIDSVFQSLVVNCIRTYIDKNVGNQTDMIKFIDYNEKNLISQNDLSKYKTFNDIKVQVGITKEQEELKKLESQVVKLYEDTEWLIIRPLTYLSSVKYGYGAKWCTAMDKREDYFKTYSTDGILIYCINKKDSYKKIACHKKIDGMLTFWNLEDTQIDSLESNLPEKVLESIRKVVTDKKASTNNKLKLAYDKKIAQESVSKEINILASSGTTPNDDIYRRAYDIMQRYTN